MLLAEKGEASSKQRITPIASTSTSKIAPHTVEESQDIDDIDDEPPKPRIIKIYTVNPCICCCCYGGFCNLKRSSILIATLEYIVGICIIITALTQYFRYVELPLEYRLATERKVTAPVIMAIKNAILCAVFLGGDLIFCAGMLTFAIVTRSAAACFFNACIVFLTSAPTLAFASFLVIALNAISDMQAIQDFPADEKRGYNDRKSWYIAFILLAGILSTFLLMYLAVCAWALGMQMISNTDDRAFTFPTGIIRINPAETEKEPHECKSVEKKGFFGGLSSRVFGNQNKYEWPQTCSVCDFKKTPH